MQFATEFWNGRAIAKIICTYGEAVLVVGLGETQSTGWGPEKLGSQEGEGGSQGSGQARSAPPRRICNEGRMERPTFAPPSPCSVDSFGGLVLHSPAYSRDAGYPVLNLRSYRP